MKLYTEEQVIALTRAAFTAGQNHNSFIFEDEFEKIKPIELPTDEEIVDISIEECYYPLIYFAYPKDGTD